MKKTTALLLTLVLAASLTGTAFAAKKPKGPKPYKSEEVTIQLGHTVQHGTSGSVVGITPQEFINTCSLPATNGIDAYVWPVPAAYKNVEATLTAFGAGGPEGYDLDIFLFNDSCELTLAAQSGNVDETTVLAKGTAYILVHNFGTPSVPAGGGGPVTTHIELKP